MPKSERRQYTIRNIPDETDRVLRSRAKRLGKSFNQVALEALVEGAGQTAAQRHDLDFMIGSISSAEAKKMDAAIRHQRKVDPELWK
jgi:plasmid stability protein